MTQQQAKEALAQKLRNMPLPHLYMIQTNQSRTGHTRHYRIFALEQDWTIEDVTGRVARVCGNGWDAITGTYKTTREDLESILRRTLIDVPGLCVFVL